MDAYGHSYPRPTGERLPIPMGRYTDMTPEDVADCLRDLNLGEFAPRFLELEVDGLILMNLTKQDLDRDFNMKGQQASRLLAFAREGWKT